MAALTTLFPVFFMLALGFIARVKGWITLEQKNGAWLCFWCLPSSFSCR